MNEKEFFVAMIRFWEKRLGITNAGHSGSWGSGGDCVIAGRFFRYKRFKNSWAFAVRITSGEFVVESYWGTDRVEWSCWPDDWYGVIKRPTPEDWMEIQLLV